MFDEKLKNYVNFINSSLKKNLPKFDETCANFVESLKYSVLNGGKRLRPVLTLAICEMFNGNLNAAAFFACSVELIHAGSLIHDDLPCMDNSYTRRNLPSCHIKFGETTAVLAGDGLFLSAFKILTESKKFNISSEKIVRACEILSKMSGFEGMVLGQAMDMFTKSNNFNKEVLNKLASLKTACLIRAACVLGVIASEVDDEIEKKIDKFAYYFGLAFQIYDDLDELNTSNNEIKLSNTKKLNYITVFKSKELLIKLAENYKKKALNEIIEFENNSFLKYLVNFIFDKFNT